ncbi:MAG: hypothetical protein ACPGQE_01845, partial [Parvibaculales bacterium]
MFGKIVSLGLILTLAACASPAEKEQLVKKKAADARIELQFTDQPEWFLNPPLDDNILYGVGTSSLSNQGAAL